MEDINIKLSDELKKYSIGYLVDNFSIYFEKLEVSGFSGREPYLANEIEGYMTYLKKTEKNLNQEQKLESLEDYFALLNQITASYSMLKRIIKIIKDNPIEFHKQGTATSSGKTLNASYIESMSIMYSELEDLFNKFANEVNSGELINLMSEEIVNLPEVQKDPLKFINKINDLYRNYENKCEGLNIIDLYTAVLNKVIRNNTGTPEGKEIIKYITKIIETLKTEILQIPILKNIKTHNQNANIIQKLIQSYNLVPYSLSITIDELIDQITENVNIYGNTKEGGANVDIIAKLKKAMKSISKELKFGFVLMVNTIKQPLEYNFWSLVDEEYLKKNNLLTDLDAGINDAMIKRYQTLSILSPGDLEFDDILYVENNEFGKNTENYYFIIETLDRRTFRLLVPWNVFAHKVLLYVPALWIENIEHAPSKRIQAYNIILEEEISKHLTEPLVTMETMGIDEIKREETYWSSLRTKIKNNMIIDFDNLFTDKLVDMTGKLNMQSIESILLNDSLYQLALNHITDNIELDNTNLTKSLMLMEQFKVELNFSYFRDLANIQKSFRRDVENIYKKDYYKKIDYIIKSETQKRIIKNKVADIYGQILDDVLERLINRRSGIYLTIEKKFNILAKCFNL